MKELNIRYSIVKPGRLGDLLRDAGEVKEVFLANENSMIDLDRIDYYNNGKVEKESVDLSYEKGNKYVLGVLDSLKSKEGIFFPGTLVEDLGSYYHLTMPVIKNGELILKRRKKSFPLFDDIIEVAEELFGEKKAEEVRSSPFKAYFEEPKKEVYNKVEEISSKNAFESMQSVEYKANRILPIICNEAFTVINHYKGKPVNLILHSCSDLIKSEESRIKYYNKMVKEAVKKDIVEIPFSIAYSECGKCSGVGRFRIGKDLKINSS